MRMAFASTILARPAAVLRPGLPGGTFGGAAS